MPIEDLFRTYCRKRDPRLLGQVFDRAAPQLLSLALHLCGNPADAEDALQATFVTAIERADSWDAARALLPWLHGILTRKAQQLHERRGRRREQPLDEGATHPSRDPQPAAAAERAELVAQLRTHVEALPDEQRQVLLLQLQHGLQPAEIAEVLAVPPGTVRMRLHRGLLALRALLPAGLATLLFGALATRGLAAVRQSVLREAARVAPAVAGTAAVAGIAGVLAMKQAIAGLALALLVGTLLWWNAAAPAGAPTGADARGAVAPAVATAAARGPEDAATDARPADRSALASGPASLRVRVRAKPIDDAGGEPLPVVGCLIQAWPGDVALVPFEGALREAETDARGEVVFAGFGAANAQVLLAADSNEEPRPVHLDAGAETVLEIARATTRVVRGMVVDTDGAPVAGAEVWVHRGTGMGRYHLPERQRLVARRGAISDANGRFAIAVGDRESTFGANHAGYGASFGADTDATRAAGELRLVLGRAFATVSGIVRDADGSPMPRVLVQVTPAGQDSRRAPDGTSLAPRVPRLVATDEHGRFVCDGLPPGTQKLWASADPGWYGWRDVDVAAFGHAEVELQLFGGCAVVGTVRQADGTPANYLGVEARPSLKTNGAYSSCGTRPDGSFRLDYVGEKGFVVTVSGRGDTVIAHREITAATRGVIHCDFEVPDARATLRGRLLDAEGRPLAHWTVSAVDEVDRTHNTSRSTDNGGAFELTALAGESFRVTAWPFDGDATHPSVERTNVRIGAEPLELRVAADALPRAQVRGRLVDPAHGALGRRELALPRCDAWSQDLRQTVRSAADGRFAFEGVSSGDFELLLVTRGGTERQLTKCTLAADQRLELGDLVVPPLATLRVEFARADGTPWTGPLPFARLFDAAGKLLDAAGKPLDVALAATVANGMRELEFAGGRVRVEIVDADLLAAPQTVEVPPGETRTLRFLVAIGRTRELRFNGDGRQHPEYHTPLHVVVHGAGGAVVEQQDIEALMPDLRGFRYWYLTRAYPFGHYEVEARSDTGLQYRSSFDVREDPEDPTRVDVPLAQ